LQTQKKFNEFQEKTTIEGIFYAPVLLGIYATNEHVNANEQVQSNVVAKEHQQANVFPIKEQVEQSFVIFIPPIAQH
jgi:hypothetical protein